MTLNVNTSWSSAATSNVWTGLNDLIVPGMYVWADEHMVRFTHWAPGQPNNHDGFNQDCVAMLHQVKQPYTPAKEKLCIELIWQNVLILMFLPLVQTGRWDDVSCTELNTFICKTPKAHYPLPSVQPTVYGCPQVWKKKTFSVLVSSLDPSY